VLLRSAAKPLTQSARLAEKTAGMFIDSTDKAVQLNAMKNALAPCSAKLKDVVEKKNMLTRSKLSIGVSDLRKLVAAAGLSVNAPASVGVVDPLAA